MKHLATTPERASLLWEACFALLSQRQAELDALGRYRSGRTALKSDMATLANMLWDLRRDYDILSPAALADLLAEYDEATKDQQ